MQKRLQRHGIYDLIDNTHSSIINQTSYIIVITSSLHNTQVRHKQRRTEMGRGPSESSSLWCCGRRSARIRYYQDEVQTLFHDIQYLRVGLQDKHIPCPMPGLPPKRRRALTLPLPDWTESPTALLDSQVTHLQTQSPFFTVLPLEMRLLVYEALFGHRTVHLDLTFDHPDKDYKIHARERAVDASRPKEWKWRHSVCHRNSRTEFWEDGCRDGLRTDCPGGSSNLDCRLHLEVLRTCRKM